MKNLFRVLLVVAGFLVGSCALEEGPTSDMQTFEPYSPALSSVTPVVTANEINGETYTFHFTLDDRQITDATISITAGSQSTAKVGEDFDILTEEVEFLALEGSDGFDVEVVVYNDYETESTETIYLTFSTPVPTGIDKTEVLVINLENAPICEYDFNDIVGARTGTDVTIDGLGWDPYPSEVVISGTTGAFGITGLGVGWMTDFWGEVITDMPVVDMEVVVVNDYQTVITIPSQTYMSTTYNSAPQETYLIEGTGTLDKCLKTITIEYSMSNYGTDWAFWTHDNGYMSEEFFTAVLSIP